MDRKYHPSKQGMRFLSLTGWNRKTKNLPRTRMSLQASSANSIAMSGWYKTTHTIKVQSSSLFLQKKLSRNPSNSSASPRRRGCRLQKIYDIVFFIAEFHNPEPWRGVLCPTSDTHYIYSPPLLLAPNTDKRCIMRANFLRRYTRRLTQVPLEKYSSAYLLNRFTMRVKMIQE